MVCAAISDGEEFYRKRILPEEIRRNRVPPPAFDGSFRWFASPNIVDMWHYRSPAEKQRISQGYIVMMIDIEDISHLNGRVRSA